MHILDDQKRIKQFDPQDALSVASKEPEQLSLAIEVVNSLENQTMPAQIVVTGMGGSALASMLAQSWLDLPIPFEVVKNYTLPAFVSKDTLVIASSYSGNTEETLSSLADAEKRGARIAVLASGGKLLDVARTKNYMHVALPSDLQPRMAVFYNLRALIGLLESLNIVQGKSNELAVEVEFLKTEVEKWAAAQPTEANLAKQIAEYSVGKTAVIYASPLMTPVAYKWKISFNENAKNLAFWNVIPEFNHNEFIGWSSHPIEKPYAVFDLTSNFDHKRVQKRFEISDRLLSGLRPKAQAIQLQGKTPLGQMLWGSVLADFATIYLAILNGVNPTPVDLVEKLKAELIK